MFDDLFRQIRSLEEGIEVRVPIEPDARGYLDKECPVDTCRFQFKVQADDWRDKFRDEQVFCPFCGHDAPANEWWTTEQIEHAEAQAVDQMSGMVGEALRQGARKFNRNQPRSGFLTMTMEVKGAREHVIVPAPSAEEFELQIKCDSCGSNFSVIGSAFFCPCCGDSSAERLFDQALAKVRAKAENALTIEQQLATTLGRDDTALIRSSLIETALMDCVVALQRLAEQLYGRVGSPERLPMNLFQRIDDGSERWRQATGHGYEEWLAPQELTDLKLLVERRHLLSHTDGMIDQRYLDRTGDSHYKVGQRIVVSQDDVVGLASLVARLGAGMRTDAPPTP